METAAGASSCAQRCLWQYLQPGQGRQGRQGRHGRPAPSHVQGICPGEGCRAQRWHVQYLQWGDLEKRWNIHWIGFSRENLQETIVFTCFYHSIWGFPVHFPVNQSNETCQTCHVQDFWLKWLLVDERCISSIRTNCKSTWQWMFCSHGHFCSLAMSWRPNSYKIFMHFHDLSEVRQSNHRAWWHWRHGVAVLPGQKRPLEQSFEPSGGGHRVLGAGTHRVQLQCLGCLVVTVCHCSPSLFQDDQLCPWSTASQLLFFGDAEKLQQSRINTSQIQVVETSISFLFRVAQIPHFLRSSAAWPRRKSQWRKVCSGEVAGGPKAQRLPKPRKRAARTIFSGDSHGL